MEVPFAVVYALPFTGKAEDARGKDSVLEEQARELVTKLLKYYFPEYQGGRSSRKIVIVYWPSSLSSNRTARAMAEYTGASLRPSRVEVQVAEEPELVLVRARLAFSELNEIIGESPLKPDICLWVGVPIVREIFHTVWMERNSHLVTPRKGPPSMSPGTVLAMSEGSSIFRCHVVV